MVGTRRLVLGCLAFAAAVAAAPPPTLQQVLESNNRFRASVAASGGDTWINRTAVARSIFNYGLPPKIHNRLHFFNLLNLEPGLQDLVTWFGAHTVARSGRGLSYLEIGVSTLKNFDTQVNAFRDNASVLSAVDIEDPNPVRASTWGQPVVVKAVPARRVNDVTAKALRSTGHRGHFKAHPCVTPSADEPCEDRTLLWPTRARDGRHLRDNTVTYDTMDQMDGSAWRRLAEARAALGFEPFDLVFSDGLHEEAAMTTEYKMLTELGLLQRAPGRDFTILWDDCYKTFPHTWRTVFHTVAPALATWLREGWGAQHNRSLCFVHLSMQNWVGGEPSTFAPKTQNCLMTTLDISTLLRAAPALKYGGLGGKQCTML